ncbi:MAG: hypothetical protein QM597_00225 [Aeromicrobium sp.]|uniref:membrane protein YczE n=1 Tax=Aeromicrobium sp. TaxID=1871063 RepID=UPI0039E5506A
MRAVIGRLLRLLVGLWLYGATMALLVEGGLGLSPWDVFHEGVATRVPLTFGQVVIVTGAVVMLLWIPLRQRPGLGTILNVIVTGVAVDVTLAWLPTPDDLGVRAAFLALGVVGNGLAGALYIGASLGTGPRDGLWEGLVWRTGGSIRIVRTALEVVILGIGFALGGTVGIGTLAYAVAIGPLVQFFLGLLDGGSAARGDDETRVGVDEHLCGDETLIGEPALADRVDLPVDDGRPVRGGREVVEHGDTAGFEQVGEVVDLGHDLADIDENQREGCGLLQ